MKEKIKISFNFKSKKIIRKKTDKGLQRDYKEIQIRKEAELN